MKQKKMKLASRDIRELFRTRLPNIRQMAVTSTDAVAFGRRLTEALGLDSGRPLSAAAETISRLIRYDGQTVREASTDRDVTIETISLLWRFLTDRCRPDEVSVDFLIDVYQQFEALTTFTPELPDRQRLVRWMKRWDTGTDPRIVRMRAANRQRIIDRLIERIDTHHSDKSRYVFPADADMAEKRRMVEEWWTDCRFHLAMAARSLRELSHLMGETLSDELKDIYHRAQKKGMPVFVTPYYLSLMDISGNGYDDTALRSYVLYSRELVDAFGHIRAWEREDQVEEGKPNAAGWLVPGGGNIHRRYPEVAILIPDTIGRACGGLCASCQRLYDFQSGRFNFDWEALKPKETWDNKLRRLMRYYRDDKQLRDILITGGDALMSRNGSLRKILHAVYTMAKHKREDNRSRPAGDKYAEIQRVRLGTRLPVYLPMRVDDELVEILSEFRQKASEIGISQFFIQTHFQTPLEITPEVVSAIGKLHGAGWTVTNQLVYNVAASRRGHTARLRRELNKIGVVCYYTFSVKGFEENHAVFAPNSRSLQEQHEEKALGHLDDDKAATLVEALRGGGSPEKTLRTLQRKWQLPFLATDRSVMNLPGIGKSMTFTLAGIMADGRRVLAFSHDSTRRHSPLIAHTPVVYILENKSIAEYIRQLCDMGESYADYASIWRYNSGRTEPRFALYEYPRAAEEFTAEYSNIACVPPAGHSPYIPHAS